ncbi:MAG: hypothetical protein ACXABH_11595, partial [Candidatus Thorarchaeota archaeon]
ENDQSVTISATVTDPGGVDPGGRRIIKKSGTVTIDMTDLGDDFTGLISGLSDTTISVKIVATDTDGNVAVRAYYSVTWGGGGTPTPIDSTLMLMIAGGVGAVILVLAVVIVVKRR